MDAEAHWRDVRTAIHYARAAVSVGLWESERRLCRDHLEPGEPLLELGCGGGRIALGLWREGWSQVTPTDLSPAMVELADAVFAEAGCPFRAALADARRLPYPDGAFAGALFGFNGLMCIRGAAARRQALAEIRRVVRPGSRLLLTAHDRERGENRHRWARESAPKVGFSPKSPHSAEGTRIEPLVSEPSVSAARPPAAAAPEPPEEPPVIRAVSCGLREGPSCTFRPVKS